LAISVVAFFFLGRWLDEKLDTAPWLMIAGAGIGIAGGMAKFIMTVSALGRKEDEERDRRAGETKREG
jgi:F0F1-type ATP synthase assembly protein I